MQRQGQWQLYRNRPFGTVEGRKDQPQEREETDPCNQ